MKFPHPCARCGMCCLTQPCPVVGKLPCPQLRFDRDRARCKLARKGIVPTGDGCCIKARAYRHGVEYDFASLPKTLKITAVRQVRWKP